MEFPKHLDPAGGCTLLQDEYGLYDGMAPQTAIIRSDGMTVAIHLTKEPTREGNNNPKEVYLCKLQEAPADIYAVYTGRNPRS